MRKDWCDSFLLYMLLPALVGLLVLSVVMTIINTEFYHRQIRIFQLNKNSEVEINAFLEEERDNILATEVDNNGNLVVTYRKKNN